MYFNDLHNIWYIEETDATSKGHLDDEQKNTRSTKSMQKNATFHDKSKSDKQIFRSYPTPEFTAEEAMVEPIDLKNTPPTTTSTTV